jgi:hypothetical protein
LARPRNQLLVSAAIVEVATPKLELLLAAVLLHQLRLLGTNMGQHEPRCGDGVAIRVACLDEGRQPDERVR